MAVVVMKFGGTSVANIERIRNVAQHVRREVDAGNQVAVVVSAMAGTTTSLSNGSAKRHHCTMRANTTQSWPQVSKSRPGCSRSCCSR